MDTHVKVVGWLWIAGGILGSLMLLAGLALSGTSIAREQDALVVASGALCFFLPGIVADFAVGFGLIKFKSWSRILAIVLGVLNLILFPIGTALALYTFWVMFNDETKVLLGES